MGTFLIIVFVIPIICIVLLVFRGINTLIFDKWLGKKDKRFKVFADCSNSWLSLSYRLPGKMKRYGMRYWWVGIFLMLMSPAAIVTFGTLYIARYEYLPSHLDDDEVPYKEYKDIAAITELDDFPTFTYSGNWVEPAIWEQHTHVNFDFDHELSAEYIEKLKELCTDEDNVYWTDKGDSCFEFHRAWDGKYIKSPISSVRCEASFEMSITKKGFTIHLNDGATELHLEDFADNKTLSKNTGVTFPSCSVKTFHCQPRPPDAYGEYTLLLDKKPSKKFLQQLENSPEWGKRNDGLYYCSYPTSDSYGECITIDPDSRVVYAEYGQWIGHCSNK